MGKNWVRRCRNFSKPKRSDSFDCFFANSLEHWIYEYSKILGECSRMVSRTLNAWSVISHRNFTLKQLFLSVTFLLTGIASISSSMSWHRFYRLHIPNLLSNSRQFVIFNISAEGMTTKLFSRHCVARKSPSIFLFVCFSVDCCPSPQIIKEFFVQI